MGNPPIDPRASLLDGIEGCLGAVGQVQCVQDAANVAADGPHRDRQLGGDLWVGEMACLIVLCVRSLNRPDLRLGEVLAEVRDRVRSKEAAEPEVASHPVLPEGDENTS